MRSRQPSIKQQSRRSPSPEEESPEEEDIYSAEEKSPEEDVYHSEEGSPSEESPPPTRRTFPRRRSPPRTPEERTPEERTPQGSEESPVSPTIVPAKPTPPKAIPPKPAAKPTPPKATPPKATPPKAVVSPPKPAAVLPVLFPEVPPVPELAVPKEARTLPPFLIPLPEEEEEKEAGEEDIVMEEAAPLPSSLDTLYFVRGKICDFGGFAVPKGVRIIMHRGTTGCVPDFGSLLRWSVVWENYLDLKLTLQESEFAAFRNFNLYEENSYVPNMVIQELPGKLSGMFRAPIHPNIVGTAIDPASPYLLLNQLAMGVGAQGGGVIFIPECRSECEYSIFNRIPVGSQLMRLQPYAVGRPIELGAEEPRGFITMWRGMPVYKWYNRYLVINPDRRQIVVKRDIVGRELVFIGDNMGKEIVVNDTEAFQRSMMTRGAGIVPTFHFGNITIKAYNPDHTEIYYGSQRLNITLTPNQYVPVQDILGLTIMDNRFYILNRTTFAILIETLRRTHPELNRPLPDFIL